MPPTNPPGAAALLIKISMRPNFSRVWLTRFFIESVFVVSHWIGMTMRLVSDSISLADSLRLSKFLEQITIFAPSEASFFAIAFPIP